jgi:hypothetical protein
VNAALGDRCVFGIKLDPDAVALQPIGNEAGCSGSEEWV